MQVLMWCWAELHWQRSFLRMGCDVVMDAESLPATDGITPCYLHSKHAEHWCGIAGADVVLGMIPLARELLRMGSEVVMVANSLPAINDVTCAELRTLLGSVCDICPILKVRLLDQNGHDGLNTVCRNLAQQI